MAYLSGAGNDFERTIDRGIGHFRSDELARAVTAIHAYITRPSADGIQAVRNALAAWRNRHPKEFADRGQPVYGPLKTELASECKRWGVPSEAPGDNLAAAVTSTKGTRGWVNAVRPALDKLGSYACADAYLGTTYNKATDKYDYNTGFARCIPVAKRPQVEKLYREMKARGAGTANPGDAMYTPGRDWKPMNYNMVYQKVAQERAGICTQFAKAAAHVLTSGRANGPRVEIVAFDNHVYVLVGRSGGYKGHLLGTDWVQDAGVVIVDPWAGSLGHPTVYENYASYPLKGMVNPLKIVAERPAS